MRFVHFCLDVSWASPSRIQKAKCFSIHHTRFCLQYRHYKKTYLTRVLEVFSCGNHLRIMLKDLAPKPESSLKSHFYLHFRRKKNRHLILEETKASILMFAIWPQAWMLNRLKGAGLHSSGFGLAFYFLYNLEPQLKVGYKVHWKLQTPSLLGSPLDPGYLAPFVENPQTLHTCT